MSSLKDYFESDFVGYFSLEAIFDTQSPDLSEKSRVIAHRHVDFASESQFSSFYIQSTSEEHFVAICKNLCLPQSNCVGFLNASEVKIGRGVSIPKGEKVEIARGTNLGDPTISILYNGQFSNTFRICRPVYIYTPLQPSEQIIKELTERFSLCGFELNLRHATYAEQQDMIEKPVAFVSHDSRDKDVAREISLHLQNKGLKVWFDDYSLKPRDRLRETIENGLIECQCCILILSNFFINNTGWTKVEFNSIFTRELIERQDRFLPVWHGIGSTDVFQYSPSLADRVAIRWGEPNALDLLTAAVFSRSSNLTMRQGSRS